MRGLLSNTLGYASERVGGLALTAVVGVLVARYLGPAGFGLLSFAAGVFGLLAPITTLGMQPVLVREFSTRSDWRSILASALAAQAPVAGLAAGFGFLIVAAARDFTREAVMIGLVMLPLPFLGLNETFRSYLEAKGRVRHIVTAGLAAAVVASGLRVLGLVARAPVWIFGLFVTVQTAVLFIALGRTFIRRGQLRAARRHFRSDTARALFRESWPLLLAGIAVTIYMRADIIMLGLLSGDAEVGVYAAAARLSEIWYFLPMAALAAARPRLAQLFASGEHAAYRILTQQFMTAATGASFAAVVAILVLAEPVIRLLYGSAFIDASAVLRIHIFAAPFVFLGVASSQWFIDHGMTRAVMVRSIASAVLNVAINLVLIPLYGATGAAVATLIAYASGVLINALPAHTRTLFWMQMRGLALRWPRATEPPSGAEEPLER